MDAASAGRNVLLYGNSHITYLITQQLEFQQLELQQEPLQQEPQQQELQQQEQLQPSCHRDGYGES